MVAFRILHEKGVLMLYKNVLVPFDDSDHARSALHTAIDLVGDDAAACIHVVMVVSSDIMPPSMLAAPSVISDTFMDYQNYEAMLAAMTERSNKELHDNVHAILGQDTSHLAARLVVEAQLSPSPVDGISAYASEHDCDLIVMGRRGLGALRGMLGSVSYGVLRTAEIPVLTVK